MRKTKISSTDLVWRFHEELQAFDDYPLPANGDVDFDE